MIIVFMRLENWRGFYGTNDLYFATEKDKNVTLVRAENGVGKTSLLAALNWCLFAILPSLNEFENPKKLLNDHARINDNENIARVDVEFLHGIKRYKASRIYNQQNNKTGEIKLVEIIDGSDIPLPSNTRADRLINSIIPREMAPHFFFYGEATSKYTGVSGAKQFGLAVKGILGATVAGMALRDLDNVFKNFNRQAADNTSGQAIALQKVITTTEERLESLDDELSKFQDEVIEAQNLVDELNKQLAGSQEIKEEQAGRIRIEAALNSKLKKLDNTELEAKGWLAKYGISLLSKEFNDDVKQLLSQEDTKKKIPGPYNEKFVNDVLLGETCICGRPIGDDSKEQNLIKSLLENASDEAVISRVITTTAALERFEERSSGAWISFDVNQENLRELNKEISDLRAQEEKISTKLRKHSTTDIAEKETARKKAKEHRADAQRGEANIDVRRVRLTTELNKAKSDQTKLVSESETAKRFVKRAQVTADLINHLQAKLTSEEDFARVSIKKKIDGIIKQFMRKNLTVQIDKDYQLKVFDENRNEASKSTGENQLLGLAFTGAIAEFAKDRQDEESDVLLSGTEAPLVVDSPFGHLDPAYRRGVADFLPKLASQVILLVSTSQASTEVMDELEGKIGAQYILVSHNKDEAGDKNAEEISVNGKIFDLTKYNQEFTGTLLEEITSYEDVE